MSICTKIDDCFQEISSYFSHEKTGYPLLVNTENAVQYNEILNRLDVDAKTTKIFVSDYCAADGLPNVSKAQQSVGKDGRFVLAGFSQALMLHSRMELSDKVGEILSYSIRGYCVVVLYHCEEIITQCCRKDPRLDRRIVLMQGESTPLPTIYFATENATVLGYHVSGIKALLHWLEQLPLHEGTPYPVVTVITEKSIGLFSDAVCTVRESGSAYDSLCQYFADIKNATASDYGTEEQWHWLIDELNGSGSFSAYITKMFGATNNLSLQCKKVFSSNEPNMHWVLWLALKIFGENNNRYLTLVLQESKNDMDFADQVVLKLADIDVTDSCFLRCYNERKQLLDAFDIRQELLEKYLSKIGRYERNAIYYLTDRSEIERHEIMRLLEAYDYPEDELQKIVAQVSEPLMQYLKRFDFDSTNTKLSDSDAAFRTTLTDYFETYKRQKVTNRLELDFVQKVDLFAQTRPFNKLQMRSLILKNLPKEGTQLYFLDALGVEYLGFIAARCENYELVEDVSIGHCALPSITRINKEFQTQFPEDQQVNIKNLDDLKHHSQLYQYTTEKLPVHLFAELSEIDEVLKMICANLRQDTIKRAVIVSDHGASRMAVLYGKERDAAFVMDEKGEHSGRCCPVDYDPEIPEATYENGYSVLANYERFKGSRKANVEVHGGASLEETIVPVIILTKKSKDVQYSFTETVVKLSTKKPLAITLYCTVPMKAPQIMVNGRIYDGEFVADKQHAKFVIPEIKRSKAYTADILNDGKKTGISLEFTAKKETREVDMF